MPGAPDEPSPRAGKLPVYKRPYAWVTSTYFAEGFPYSIVNNLAEVLFTELGAGLRAIGLTSIFHLPWNLKFLWGPFLDDYETKRRWLLATEVLLSIVLVIMAFVSTSSGLIVAISIGFFVIAFLSATHDAAVDGYYMEALDRAGQDKFVGYRAAAYRVATVVVAGQLLVLAGYAGWFIAFGVAALAMGAITAFHFIALPRVETPQAPVRALLRAVFRPRVLTLGIAVSLLVYWWRTSDWVRDLDLDLDLDLGVGAFIASTPVLRSLPIGGWIGVAFLLVLLVMLVSLERIKAWLGRRDSSYARSFVHFLEQPKIVPVLVFVLLFRTGESFVQKMRYPFLKAEASMSLTEYGYINGNIGWIAAIFATILGGHLINKHGLRRWIWPFVLMQNTLNLLYYVLASLDDPASVGTPVLALIMTVEHFGAGLGTAVFMVYTLRCCDPRHKAANMAIVTSMMSLGFTLAGAISGDLAESMGFQSYFLMTFLVTIPSMLLLFVVPHLDSPSKA